MEQSPLEKLRVTQVVKKFPTFYGTRRFITVFTRAHSLLCNFTYTELELRYLAPHGQLQQLMTKLGAQY
jgi:hypothetical protein